MQLNKFEPQTHINHINAAIEELASLHSRTAAPALIPHQFIGTAVDNTIVLLTAPANSLDQGNRCCTFTEPSNWISLMQAVHRSFFSSVHTFLEAGLIDICEKKELLVKNSISKQNIVELDKIQELVDKAGIEISVKNKIEVRIGKLRKPLEHRKPEFNDYLNTVLNSSSLPEADKKTWRNFFDALRIVRNKCSHADSTLNDTERQNLNNGGCAVMVAESGDFAMNTRMYVQVATHILNFLDLVMAE